MKKEGYKMDAWEVKMLKTLDKILKALQFIAISLLFALLILIGLLVA